ncbi:MAG: D-serine ammonia-lyase [Synergistaceae bacterium]|nr:D-serine ammonia-lyase [Synergistaceae bacterium]
MPEQKISALVEKNRLLKNIMELEEVFWANPEYKSWSDVKLPLSKEDISGASARLKRFAPYIAKVFPETAQDAGIIESPLVYADSMKNELENIYGAALPGRLLLKCDSHLKISGSIKARGGIYEVLKHAENLALREGLLQNESMDYELFASPGFVNLFSQYEIAVGSTGNLGLSIGIMAAKMGFKASVHMSADAKQWKKDKLRSLGVNVREYESDYSAAVSSGRKEAEANPRCHFVDDENSADLFLGYAVAAERLKIQLDDMGIKVGGDHPLFVYLPCGVGGGPGGVAFGLKQIYGDGVHFFFAEPTHSPCMTIGLVTGLHDKVCVQDFGIDNMTEADGLAVGRASGLVGPMLRELVSGCYTISDETMFKLLAKLAECEKIMLEPSALAGMTGIVNVIAHEVGRGYLRAHGLAGKESNITHIAWATGGSMVPDEIMKGYYEKGKSYLGKNQTDHTLPNA